MLSGLEKFRGVLVTDAAKIFTGDVRQNKKIELALCNSHARRYFHKARESDGARAAHALSVYRTIARLEHECAAMSASDRTAFRQRKIGPVFDAFVAWAEVERTRIQPRGPIAEAIDYLRTFRGRTTRANACCARSSWVERHGSIEAPSRARRTVACSGA